MRFVVCEDEAAFSERLISKIRAFFDSKEIETEYESYNNGDAFLAKESYDYDIIFLDINLGRLDDGMKIAHELRRRGVSSTLIFVTSLENRAVDGYDVGAYGFVVKNDLDTKLPRVLEKLWKEFYCKRSIAVTGKDFTELIGTDIIVSAQSRKRLTLVHTETGDYEDIRPIMSFAEVLGTEEFVETHKSVYVNISKIKRINSDTADMCDGTTVPLSRRNRKNVMYAVMKRLGGK